MSNIDKLFRNLSIYMTNLEISFLQIYLDDPLNISDSYELHARAYCVLAHAALEEYVETVAIEVLSTSIDRWKNQGEVQDCLITVAVHYLRSDSPSIGQNDKTKVRETKNLLSAVLNNANKWFQAYVQSNHGIGVKYLKKLLEPVGIDISNNPVHLSSLATLVAQRGDFAHTFTKMIPSTLSPVALKQLVTDCIDLCDEIRQGANQKITAPNNISIPTPSR